jgi:pyruvate dehydrogenase E2 component (dihydrolipoamide acetyltransferase)
MSNEITMPKLSDTMEEGKILRWLKHPGDKIARGEAIAEVETDKADMVLEAFEEGVLDQIKLNEGESAPVGAVIAMMKTAGAADPAGATEKSSTPPKPTEIKPIAADKKTAEPRKKSIAPAAVITAGSASV